MSREESEHDRVRRHVARGRDLVEQQRRLVAKLRSGGHPLGGATQLLHELERSQGLHEAHLRRLEDTPADE